MSTLVSRSSDDSGSDVESQTSRPTVEHEKVWVNMPDSKCKIWEDSVGTKPVRIGGPFHSHPFLAASRFVLETQAASCAKESLLTLPGVDWSRGKVVDIGAAPKRTAPLLRALGHFMMPNLQIGDDTRFRQCPREYQGQVCRCTFEQCNHVFGEDGLLKEPTAFIAIHSAYYLDRLTLWRRLRDPLMAGFFAVGHSFDEPYGGFYDEAEWEQHGSRITMRVEGQMHVPYEHDILPWTLDWRGPNGEAFEAEAIRSVMGFSYLWRVHAVIKLGSPAPKLFSSVISDDRYWGPLQFSNMQKYAVAVNAKSTLVELDIDHVEKVGRLLVTTSTPFGGVPVVVCMPVGLISELAAIAVNGARDPNLLTFLTFNARRIVAKAKVPVSEQPMCIATAVALAMVTNIGVEVDAQHTVQSRFDWQFKALKTLIQFEPLQVWRLWKMVLTALLILAPPIVVTVVQDDREVDIIAWVVGFVVWLLIVACGWGAVTISREIARYSTARWSAWYRQGYATPNPLFSIPSVQERLLPGSDNIREVGEVGEEVSIVLREDHRGPGPNPKVRAHLAGLVADTAVVNVSEPTQESELSAISHRIGGEKLNPDWATLNLAKATIHSVPFTALFDGFEVDNSGRAFYVWLNNQRAKYPAVLIEKWKQIWNLMPDFAFFRNAGLFQKLELNGKPVTMDGQTPVKTRLISPPSDEAKVFTGPAASQFYNRCVKIWDGLAHPILYASGRTTDYIGKVLDGWIADLGGENKVVGLSFDCSNYDSTLRHPQQFVVCDLYMLAGITIEVIRWFFETVAKGVTPHGVQYALEASYDFHDEMSYYWFTKWLDHIQWPYKTAKVVEKSGTVWNVTMVDFMMSSGRMDTNLMDTLFNALAFFSYVHATGVDVRMMVCGDDNFSVMRASECTEEWFNGLQEHLTKLGLNAIGTKSANRADWEFCSKLFWFGIDPATGLSQTVLGPKPGRAMTRMGITVSVPRAANIAATAISLKKDAHHVPYIRCLADRTYELCRDAKLRPSGREWEGLRASKSFDLDPRNFCLSDSRYGLRESAEDELRSVLRECTSLPQFYHWEPIAAMALRDAE